MKKTVKLMLGILLAAYNPLFAMKPDLPQTKPLNFKPPQGSRHQLKNGMTIYILNDNTLPIINATAFFKTGNIYEPKDKTGLAQLTANLLRNGGTAGYTPEEMDKKLEFLSASVKSRMFAENAEVSMRCLSKDFDSVFDIYSEILTKPSFNKDKLKLAKELRLEEIRRRNDNPARQASREAVRMFYGKDHPYGRRAEPETVKSVSRKDVLGFYSNFYKPNNAILAISGDFKSEKEILKKINDKFSSWKAEKIKFPKIPPVKIKEKRTVYVIDKDISQTSIVILQKGLKRHDPIEFPLSVANQILGGDLSSRLALEIRSKKGLAYTVYSYFNKRPDYGYILAYCGTKPETYSQALGEMLNQFEKMRKEQITAKELNASKKAIINSFIFRFPTPFSLMEERASYELFGYSKNYLDSYTDKIAQVSRKNILNAAERLFNPSKALIFIIGNAKKFDKPLSDFGKVIKLKED